MKTHKCCFKECERQIPLCREACDECVWKLHETLCRMSGITKQEDIKREYERRAGGGRN